MNKILPGEEIIIKILSGEKYYLLHIIFTC